MKKRIRALALKYQPEVVALRRHFHAHPELGGQETATQEKIIQVLTSLGLPARRVSGTGVVAELRGSQDGPLIVARADMDALPIADECGQPYQSVVSGVCHACGHDGHVAMLLGVAGILAELRSEFGGTIRLLFQPSEEKFPGGALGMMEAGALDGAAAIFGAHLWQPTPIGRMDIAYGRMMASASIFRITLQGGGGHSSAPHKAVNPIALGAGVVAAINQIAGTGIDPLEPVAISVGAFQSGEAENIIPATASIRGTVRCYDEQIRREIFDRIEAICRGACQAHQAKYSLERLFGYPALINDKSVAEIAVAAAGEVLGTDAVSIMSPSLGCEDFAYYLTKIPGAFMFIGTGNPEAGIVYPHHHPRFDIDERSLTFGMEIMANTALRLLRSLRTGGKNPADKKE